MSNRRVRYVEATKAIDALHDDVLSDLSGLADNATKVELSRLRYTALDAIAKLLGMVNRVRQEQQKSGESDDDRR